MDRRLKMKVKIFERSGEPSRLEREINDFLATLGPGAVLNTQTAIAAVRNENEQIETALLPKPDSLALYPARGDLGPASHPIGPFGLEDRRLSRANSTSVAAWRKKYSLLITLLSPWYPTSADAITQELDICSKPKVQK